MKKIFCDTYAQYLSKYAYIFKYTSAYKIRTVLKCREHSDEWDRHYLGYDGTYILVRMTNYKCIFLKDQKKKITAFYKFNKIKLINKWGWNDQILCLELGKVSVRKWLSKLKPRGKQELGFLQKLTGGEEGREGGRKEMREGGKGRGGEAKKKGVRNTC